MLTVIEIFGCMFSSGTPMHPLLILFGLILLAMNLAFLLSIFIKKKSKNS
ncbi:MAG: hypothetical protein KAR79_04960 [Simkaniaceae bacterium]|nr:hypothetical protein [Simkaniaceae bacterium]